MTYYVVTIAYRSGDSSSDNTSSSLPSSSLIEVGDNNGLPSDSLPAPCTQPYIMCMILLITTLHGFPRELEREADPNSPYLLVV